MPRTAATTAIAVVAFFRTASMEVVGTVLDLCKDAVKERKDRGDQIRAAQATAQRREIAKKAAAKRPARKAVKKKVAKVAAPAPKKAKTKPRPRRGAAARARRVAAGAGSANLPLEGDGGSPAAGDDTDII